VPSGRLETALMISEYIRELHQGIWACGLSEHFG